MSALAIAARIVVAVALAVAATKKIVGRASLRDQLRQFGSPDALTPAIGVLLPAAELLIAVLLVVVPGSSWPAWLACALLGAFTVLVGMNLARGNRVPCPCFGTAGATPISSRTIVRNGWLLALAVIGTGSTSGASAVPTAGLALGLGIATAAILRLSG